MFKRFVMKLIDIDRIDPAWQIVIALILTGVTMGLLIATILLHLGGYHG